MIRKHFPHVPTQFKMTSPVFVGIQKNVNKTVLCYGSRVWPLKTFIFSIGFNTYKN